MQAVTGPCLAYFPRYYYSIDGYTCKEFIYGGCAGNENNFETKIACERKCDGYVPVSITF